MADFDSSPFENDVDERQPDRLSGLPRIDFRAELNDDQYAAVTAPDGPALVLAGAGSGKTRTLTYRVAWLLEERNVPSWQMLLLTFTNKAAREMLERVELLTGRSTRSGFWGGTFHSLGARFLRLHGEAIGLKKEYTILDADEAEKLLESVVKSADPDFLKDKSNPKKSVIFDLISYSRNTRRSLDSVLEERLPWAEPAVAESIADFAERYRKRKFEQQVVDYDDLLELWLRLLEEHPTIAERYQRQFRYILVDEYQDTNTLQSAIIDKLASDHQVMAVGDDAQCIYTWRGADFENIRSFPERHPGTTIYKIEVNYRSTPEILHLANQVISLAPTDTAYHKELRACRSAGMKPLVIPVLEGSQQANFVARRIAALLEEGVPHHEIAVLYRAHYQSLDLQLELSRRNIPFAITSGLKFFELAHIKDVIAHLRLAYNPGDTVAFLRLASMLPKLGEKTALKLYSMAQARAQKAGETFFEALADKELFPKVPELAREDWEQMTDTLLDLSLAYRPPGAINSTPTAAITAAQIDLFSINAESYKPTSAPKPAVPASPIEMVRLVLDGWYSRFARGFYKDWADRSEDLQGLLSYANRFTDIGEFLAQITLLAGETASRQAEPDREQIRLTTVHQAKGLEYRAVFVIGCADGFFPLRRAIESGDLDEERRLFYVAVTRAMDELYLLYPQYATSGGTPQKMDPSQFLNELPDSCYKLLRLNSGMR